MAENVFEAVKQSVSTREAAEFYGIKVSRTGMACCPFHDDKNPSMKLNEEYFYCFGCGATVNVEDIENLISSIVTVPIDDGVKFQLKSISEIMDEAEYPGIRVSMSTTFDGVVTPLKIDISTGDAITPREVRYSFKLMLEDRSIDIWAYNLETVLAEKLETIITRTTTNTRMRDFYDIYILEQLHGTTLNPKILHDALLATAHKRGSEKYLNQAEEVFDEVENDSVMQKLWEAYRKKFSYASDLEWDVIMKAIRRLYVLCEKGISL